MNKTIVSLLMTFAPFICSLSLNAQKNFQQDTTYYETFPNKTTVRLYLSKKYVHLNFPSGGSADDLEYKANPKLNLGAGITIKNISINLFNGFSFLNKNTDEKGKTKGFNFQVHLYPHKWAIDLLYVAPKGYHLEPKGMAGAPADKYYYREDVKTTFFGISAYQVPNKKRFSYRAALLQSEWQKKSAGSIIYGGEIHHGTMQGDSALVPALLSSTYPQRGINKMNVLSFGPGAGYAYTLVIAKHFFITGSMVINLDANFVREEDEVRKEKNFSLNPSEVFKLATGYNGKKWNISANWTGSASSVQGSLTPDNYVFPSGNVRVVVARRFERHKHSS
ncbi:MAG TPA: DUF4421 domain-containing protein [Chitinophagaceae bacterium]|jgi:hypothetical protein|nr:DUF4421 domain-containing protein [Chitinophagaceae bacterium]